MAWRLAQSLLTLLAEVNALHPDRHKGTDGGISGYTYGPGGIVANPNNQSSHNINSAGVVCAFDITTGNYAGGISVAAGQALAEQIRIRVRDQPRGIPFYGIHYMAPPYVAIAGPKICTYGTNWEWENYGGSDPHTSHQHWSADWDVFPGGAPSGLADYDSTLPWNLTTLTGLGSGITPIQEDEMSAADVTAITASVNFAFNRLLKELPGLIADAVLTKQVPHKDPATGKDDGQTTSLATMAGFADFQATATRDTVAAAARAMVDAVVAAPGPDAEAAAEAAYDAFLTKLDGVTIKVGTK